ncbi:hypothetical protein HQN89_15920 [Paenibacillus frigoriresistens]|uniref:hypothetical protein n=1 Tax=Paenibacillus alginolyticus TaxID=59839 RepID=UPI001564FB03|nr:hypothetical protein [Paenibacillus frigoriresistens]NRF92495.1 hypothetical protein [Paenibacillus frigoriresistens]
MSILSHEYAPAQKEEEDRKPEEALDVLQKQGIVPTSSVLSPRRITGTQMRFRELDPRLLLECDRELLAQDVLLALYARIATCLKHGMDITEYIRVWM